MQRHGVFTLLSPFFVLLALLLLLLMGLRTVGVHATTAPAAPSDRATDPVIISGTQLSAFLGVPIEELRLYRYDDGWEPVPFQVDERDITGTYVMRDNGMLDERDVLVFMGGDVGAPGEEWPEDETARSYPRARIEVGDPLDGGATGWSYLYRSTTLPTSERRYVTWEQEAQRIEAISYTAAFTSDFVGLADLTLNGDPTDVLDRQKVRVTAFNGIVRLNEEGLTTFFTPTITFPITGPVRLVRNGEAFNLAIYGARFDSSLSFDTSALPATPETFRASFDLNDPAATGITGYWDSNGTSATIDGAPDTVPSSPLIEWYQASGAPGGIVVAYPRVQSSGSASTYYEDDATVDPTDTGDQRAYGDSGIYIDAPGSVIEVALSTFILPPGSNANVGASYVAHLDAPLETSVTTQRFGSQPTLFLPLVSGNAD